MVIIDREKCVGCGLCALDCLARAISVEDGRAAIVKGCFHCGHCVAICPAEAVRIEGGDYDMRDVEPVGAGFGVGAEAFLHAVKTRRSIRQFGRECPSRAELETILEAGCFSPTASNAQNVSYIVFTEGTERLRALAMAELRKLKDDEQAFYTVFPPPMSLSRVHFEDDDFLFKGAPAVILTVSPHAVNAAIASCNMEMEAAALGLGALYVGFFARLAAHSEALRSFLGLKPEDTVVTCLALGPPAVEYQRTVPRRKAQIDWR
ncbi:MAG: nitroreductase family protein [Oscillospiraceae bacterium]|nr:nitroreductase family protein [Oscillospiraceae bacterium]